MTMRSPSAILGSSDAALRVGAGREDDVGRDRDRVEVRARHEEASHLLVDGVEVEEAPTAAAELGRET